MWEFFKPWFRNDEELVEENRRLKQKLARCKCGAATESMETTSNQVVAVYRDKNCSLAQNFVSQLNEKMQHRKPHFQFQEYSESNPAQTSTSSSLCLFLVFTGSARIQGFYNEELRKSISQYHNNNTLFINLSTGAKLPSNEGHSSVPSGYTTAQGKTNKRVINIGYNPSSKTIKDTRENRDNLSELHSILCECI
eukprot:gb/GECH01008604.1/.p1 GENE.gb/GECH01008604.1/~~gb/GECH01008604.1/.p1  ORF type:complete len:195 (+),score=42.24 gb/GECH01008604.1/:1-585(+)